jgi:hypothetical protein
MIEAGAPSTEEVVAVLCMVCAPLGVVMVSPPTIQRNASRAQSEGHVVAREGRTTQPTIQALKRPEPDGVGEGIRGRRAH